MQIAVSCDRPCWRLDALTCSADIASSSSLLKCDPSSRQSIQDVASRETTSLFDQLPKQLITFSRIAGWKIVMQYYSNMPSLYVMERSGVSSAFAIKGIHISLPWAYHG